MDNLCKNVDIDQPFPPVAVEGPNSRYADILAKLYAGYDGELTATANYIYQNIILEEENDSAAKLLECIAKNEMRHFHILGELIYLLGSDPKLYAPDQSSIHPRNGRRSNRMFMNNNYRTVWWTGENLPYIRDFIPMIRENIIMERTAIANYNAALNLISDQYIQALIRRIILNEQRHIEIFEGLLQV